MNQVSSNVRGYVSPTIPQKSDASILGVTEYDLGGGVEGSSDWYEDINTGVLYISPSQLTRHTWKPIFFTTKCNSNASFRNGKIVNSFVILRFLL